MTKEQFLFQLEQLLLSLPAEERQEALDYYRNYFDDAGTTYETDVLAELGTPAQVAASIKEGLNNAGAETVRQPPQMREMLYENRRTAERKQTGRKSKWFLLLVVAVVTCPAWCGLLGALFGVLAAVLAAIFLVCVAGVLLAGAGLLGGVVIWIVGIMRFFTADVVSGLMTFGIGMLLFSLGCLSSVCLLLVFGKLFPFLVRAVCNSGFLRGFRKRKLYRAERGEKCI